MQVGLLCFSDHSTVVSFLLQYTLLQDVIFILDSTQGNTSITRVLKVYCVGIVLGPCLVNWNEITAIIINTASASKVGPN